MKFKNEEGYVLVLSVLILSVLLILMFSMSNMINSDLSFFRNTSNSDRAFFAAEGAISFGTEIFYQDELIEETGEDTGVFRPKDLSSLNTQFSNASVSSLEWEYGTLNSLPIVILTATGNSGGVSRTIRTSYYTNSYNTIFDNVISSGGEITIKNNHILTDGDITTTVGVDGEFRNTDDELVEVNVDPTFEIPTFDYDYLKSLADNVIDIEGGDIEFTDLVDHSEDDSLDIDDDIGQQFTYIEGDLNIKTNRDINGSGVIVVDGKLTMGSNIRINQEAGYEDEYLIIIVRGQGTEDGIILDGDNKIEIRGLIYSAGDTDIGNQLELTGSIISGGDLSLINSNASSENIIYDPGFIQKFMDWGLKFEGDEYSEIVGVTELVEWKEL
ncbi:MAG: hypothetical protein ACOCRO_05945 [Halanaerobiales bacterium]